MAAGVTVEARDELQQWRGLLVTGAWAALAGVALILVQMAIYVLSPPPESTIEFYELLNENPALGLLSLDVIYVVSNVFAFLMYLAFAVVLWRVSRSGVTIALGLGTLGMAAYMASPRAVEMLSLAQSYADADAAERTALVAVGDGMLATWMGTAFDIYYIFNGIALLIIVILMLRSAVFSRATARWGLAAAVLMAVPSNFGTVGLIFAIASLIPWAVFAVLVGLRLLRIVHRVEAGAAAGAAAV